MNIIHGCFVSKHIKHFKLGQTIDHIYIYGESKRKLHTVIRPRNHKREIILLFHDFPNSGIKKQALCLMLAIL